MLKRNRKKWLIAGGGGLVLLAVILVALFQWPAHQFTLDVNPSLRITTNRMEQVIDLEALNSDGGQFLEGYEPPGRNLEVVINDLVDRMILTGNISGGRDNIVMITVDSDELDSKYLEKVNEAIAAFLQNRELEYRILNQGVTDFESEDRENQQEILEEVSPGKQALIRKLMEEDETLTPEELDEISLGDLLRLAGEMNLSPNELFARIIGSDTGDDEQESSEPRDDYMPRDELDIVRGWDFAINAALEAVGGGMVVSFEYDQDEEYEIEILYNGYRYEIEMNAYTAEILEMEREADDQAEEYLAEQEHLIGWIRAVEIAEEEIGGGTVVEFEYDRDDGEYEMEIRYNGNEYDVKIDAYTGEILEFDN